MDPEQGLLPPDQFIPILEDTKLIYKLDLYMLEQVLLKMEDQAKAGLYVAPSSINLSRTDFDCCDMVEEVPPSWTSSFNSCDNSLSKIRYR